MIMLVFHANLSLQPTCLCQMSFSSRCVVAERWKVVLCSVFWKRGTSLELHGLLVAANVLMELPPFAIHERPLYGWDNKIAVNNTNPLRSTTDMHIAKDIFFTVEAVSITI